jgi:hypothetical protein
MRRATVLLTAAAAAVVVAVALPLPVAAAPPAPRAAVVMPVLTGVSLSTGAVSVRGLDVAPVTVTVTTTGDAGPCSENVGEVGFYRTSKVWDRSAPSQLGGRLACVSDSGGMRTYRASVPVASTTHGTWRFWYVRLDSDPYDLDLRTVGLPAPTLGVTGSHRPRLRFALTPHPLPYPGRTVTMTVRATFDDTGAPVVGQFTDVTYGGVTPCPGCSGTTDAKGRMVRPVPVTDHRQVVARMPLKAPGFLGWSPVYSVMTRDVVVQPALTASPARSSVPHGTNVDVNGQAFVVGVKDWSFKPRADLVLQRLVGRHWRTVSWSGVRPTGRFTVVATPPKGRNLYRVLMGSQHDFGPGTSRAFLIRGS